MSIAGLFAGDPQIGIQYATQALRLSPRDPARFLLLNLLGWAHFSARNYESGVDWAEHSVGESPNFPASHLCVLLNAVGLGQIERAKAAFQIWQKLAPAVVEERLRGEWLSGDRDFTTRATSFLRIAAGLDEPGAASQG